MKGNSETWQEVRGFGGNYEASTLGRIRSKPRTVIKRTRYGGVMEQRYPARILSPSEEKGYLRVHLSIGGKKRKVWVHTMVLCAFDRLPSKSEVCRHLDGNRRNNKPGNLVWGTHLENMRDRKSHGRYAEGEDHAMAKYSPLQIQMVRQAKGFTGTELSKLTGISESHISRIRRNKTWRNCA